MYAQEQVPSCEASDRWLRNLFEGYQEVVIWRGFGTNGTTIIITANSVTGSWTIGVSIPGQGVICTQADGVDFEMTGKRAQE